MRSGSMFATLQKKKKKLKKVYLVALVFMQTQPVIQHSYYCANILCHFYHTQTQRKEARRQQNYPGLIPQHLTLYMHHFCGFFHSTLQQQSKEVELSWAMATFVIVYFKELEHQMGGIYFSESAKYIVTNSTH